LLQLEGAHLAHTLLLFCYSCKSCLAKAVRHHCLLSAFSTPSHVQASQHNDLISPPQNFKSSGVRGVTQAVECLLSKCKTLSSNPSTAKKNSVPWLHWPHFSCSTATRGWGYCIGQHRTELPIIAECSIGWL
jgi:hypothetical protein